jgi:hypothetical protein
MQKTFFILDLTLSALCAILELHHDERTQNEQVPNLRKVTHDGNAHRMSSDDFRSGNSQSATPAPVGAGSRRERGRGNLPAQPRPKPRVRNVCFLSGPARVAARPLPAQTGTPAPFGASVATSSATRRTKSRLCCHSRPASSRR